MGKLMSFWGMLLISLLGGWSVNVVADALPSQRTLRETWRTPLWSLPATWIQSVGLALPARSDTKHGTPASTLRYRVVFFAAFLLGWLALIRNLEPLSTIVLAIQAWFFLAIAVIDLEHRLVLNRMLLFALPFVLLGNALLGIPSLTSALLGGAAGFGFFLLLAVMAPGAMGMGDVKLAGFIGLLTGLSGVMMALFWGILTGGIAGGVVLIRNRFRRGNTLAYAPYLVLGTWIFLFNVVETVHLYLERL
ncbi:MAG: A24 family peptidase [Caldilineaceae bacterium]